MTETDTAGHRSPAMARVLLVEYDQQVLDMLCILIYDAGHHAECVTSIAEAFERLAPGSYSLVVADVTLPDGSGHEVASRAADLGIRTILMTGHPNHIQELLDSTIPHLIKPFPIEQFLALVTRHLPS